MARPRLVRLPLFPAAAHKSHSLQSGVLGSRDCRRPAVVPARQKCGNAEMLECGHAKVMLTSRRSHRRTSRKRRSRGSMRCGETSSCARAPPLRTSACQSSTATASLPAPAGCDRSPTVWSPTANQIPLASKSRSKSFRRPSIASLLSIGALMHDTPSMMSVLQFRLTTLKHERSTPSVRC